MSGQLRMAKVTPESLLERRERPLDRQFQAFHAANPHVYDKLRELALQVRSAGQRMGIAALFERLRWLSRVETAGDPYRLNNSYRAYYARLLMEREPSLRGSFTTRTDRTDPDYRTRVARVRPPRRRQAGERLSVTSACPVALPF